MRNCMAFSCSICHRTADIVQRATGFAGLVNARQEDSFRRAAYGYFAFLSSSAFSQVVR